MDDDNAYPQPHEDADNEPMLRAWRERGELLVQRCGACKNLFFYPRPMCPECWSEQLSWESTGGTGEIVSFSLVHRPNHPSFNDEVPIVLAEIRLGEGPSLLARVVDCDADEVRSGMAVALVQDAAVARYPLPTFTLG